jgi:hypothetical protein
VGCLATARRLRRGADVVAGEGGADASGGEAPGAQRGAAAVRGRRPPAAAAAGRGARPGQQEGRQGQEPLRRHPRQGQHARRNVRAQPGKVAGAAGAAAGGHHPAVLQMRRADCARWRGALMRNHNYDVDRSLWIL